MTIPTTEQIQHALSIAERKRTIGDDPDHLVATLLYWHPRIEQLERVAHAAELYLRFGLGETEHAVLTRELAALRELEVAEPEKDPEDFGLG